MLTCFRNFSSESGSKGSPSQQENEAVARAALVPDFHRVKFIELANDSTLRYKYAGRLLKFATNTAKGVVHNGVAGGHRPLLLKRLVAGLIIRSLSLGTSSRMGTDTILASNLYPSRTTSLGASGFPFNTTAPMSSNYPNVGRVPVGK